MPRLKNSQDLTALREQLQKTYQEAQAKEAVITVGMGTCGLAAGACEVYQLIQDELGKRGLFATLRSVGCIGFCVKEPLVDIQLAGQSRVTYANVTPAQVHRLIEEHLVQGQPVQEWVFGHVPNEW